MASLYLSCLLKALSSNTVTMGLGFQHVNFAGTQFSPLQRIFRETISGQTQISESQGCISYACGKDQSYFYFMTQQVRVMAKRQVNLRSGEIEQKTRMSRVTP